MVILEFVQTCFSGFIFIGLSYPTQIEKESWNRPTIPIASNLELDCIPYILYFFGSGNISLPFFLTHLLFLPSLLCHTSVWNPCRALHYLQSDSWSLVIIKFLVGTIFFFKEFLNMILIPLLRNIHKSRNLFRRHGPLLSCVTCVSPLLTLHDLPYVPYCSHIKVFLLS